MELKSDIQIQGTFVTVDQVVIWSGRRVVVYEFSPDAQHARVVGKEPVYTFNPRRALTHAGRTARQGCR